MFSLDNVVSIAELEAWQSRLVRALGEEPDGYVCELKIDGLAVSLSYVDGRLAGAATRGDGADRRGRHRQHPDHRGGAAPPPGRPSGGDGGAGRGVHAGVRVRRAQRPAGRARAPTVRQPAEHGSGLGAAEGPGQDRSKRNLSVWVYQVGYVEGGPTLRSHAESLAWLTELGLRTNPAAARVPDLAGIEAYVARHVRAPPRSRLRDRRGGGEGRPVRPAAAGGVHRQEPPLGGRLQAPPRGEDHQAAQHRDQRRADRSGHPYAVLEPGVRRRGVGVAAPRSTTRESCTARTSAPATRSWCGAPATSSLRWWRRSLAMRRRGARKWHMPKVCPFCGNPIVTPEGEARARCTGGYACPGPAPRAPLPLRLPRRHGHRRARLQDDRPPDQEGLIADPADIFSWTPTGSCASTAGGRPPSRTCGAPSTPPGTGPWRN